MFFHLKNTKPTARLVGFIIIISAFLKIGFGLGEFFYHPEDDQLEIIKVNQALYFSQNNTINLPYKRAKIKQPNSLITYDDLSLNQYLDIDKEFASWFNIRAFNVSLSSLTIYSEAAN